MFALLAPQVDALNYAIDRPVAYEMSVEMSGALPVLGWRDGAAKLTIGFEVRGIQSDNPIVRRVSHRLTSFKSELNGAALPFRLDNVRAFFPDSTVEYSPNGVVLKNDAPKRDLPSAIPGLDQQRFPEMTYLPLIWPKMLSKSWSFERVFAGAPMHFNAEIDPVDPLRIKFNNRQIASRWEDNRGQSVESKESAAFQVDSHVEGEGFVELTGFPGVVRSLRLTATTKSDVLKVGVEGVVSKREWKTVVELRNLPSAK